MVQVLRADEHQGFSRPDGGGRNHRRVLLPGFFAEEGDDPIRLSHPVPGAAGR